MKEPAPHQGGRGAHPESPRQHRPLTAGPLAGSQETLTAFLLGRDVKSPATLGSLRNTHSLLKMEKPKMSHHLAAQT